MRKLREDQRNRTTDYFYRLYRAIFFCSAMNFWVEEIGLSEFLVKTYQVLAKFISIAAYLLIGYEWGAFLTQHSLTEKQKADRFMISFSHTVIYSFIVVLIHRKESVEKILFTLAVELKQDFNDEEVEKQMLKRMRFYASAFALMSCSTLVFYGVDGLIQVLYSNGTFVTLITCWPDVNDHRAVAGAARIAIYVFWWLFLVRIVTAYTIILSVTICLSHQFTNLQVYFKSLEEIFQHTNLSQRVKEARYEKALKVGVKWHATTLWCTQHLEKICGPVYSGQIILNITVLVLLMSQMMNSGRTMGNVLPIVATIICQLFCTGLIMWNTGDITVEAGLLPAAIFQSGWHHCRNKSSYRIRRLLLIAITQSQKPVVLRCLGVVDLSYESYLSIAKASYSVFSVLY